MFTNPVKYSSPINNYQNVKSAKLDAYYMSHENQQTYIRIYTPTLGIIFFLVNNKHLSN